MTINDVYEHYDRNWQLAMRELGLSRSAYSHWQMKGRVPFFTQKRISLITNGKLKAEKYVD